MAVNKQCPEGLIVKEPAMLHNGERSWAADQTTEYRCELDQNHNDWHVDGETCWKTY